MFAVHDDHLFDQLPTIRTLYLVCLRHFEFIQTKSVATKHTTFPIQSSFGFSLGLPLQSDPQDHMGLVLLAALAFFHLLISNHTCDHAFCFFFESNGYEANPTDVLTNSIQFDCPDILIFELFFGFSNRFIDIDLVSFGLLVNQLNYSYAFFLIALGHLRT